MQKGPGSPDWPTKPGSGDGLRAPRVARGGGAECGRYPETPWRPQAGGVEEMGWRRGGGGGPAPPAPPQRAAARSARSSAAAGPGRYEGGGQRAWPDRYLPRRPRLHPRQGWGGGLPQETKRGRGGLGPKGTLSLPGRSPPPAASPPAASPGPLRPEKEAGSLCSRLEVWGPDKGRGRPCSTGIGDEGTNKRHHPVFCRREARPGRPLHLIRPHSYSGSEAGDCAPGPLREHLTYKNPQVHKSALRNFLSRSQPRWTCL